MIVNIKKEKEVFLITEFFNYTQGKQQEKPKPPLLYNSYYVVNALSSIHS